MSWRAATPTRWATLLLAVACTRATDRPTETPALSAADASASVVAQIDGERMHGDLSYLASDDLGGRYSLNATIEKAADYIVAQYRAAGVEPVGEYKVPFPIRTGATIRGTPTLTSKRGGGKPKAVSSSSFTVRLESGSGEASGEVVFVGYAARSEAGDDGKRAYDDLAGLELQDKIALVLLESPGRPDMGAMFRRLEREASEFANKAHPLVKAGNKAGMAKLHVRARKTIGALVEPYLRGKKLPAGFYAAPDDPMTDELNVQALMGPVFKVYEGLDGPKFGFREGRLRTKLQRVADAGAVGAIVVRGPRSFVDAKARKTDELPKPDGGGRPSSGGVDIPVVQMRWKAADRLFRTAGKGLVGLQKDIDTNLEPRSGPTGRSVEIKADIEAKQKMVPNVLGMIPGSDLASEIVLLGAHFDHIGRDAEGQGHCSEIPGPEGSADAVCNGADDNASGSAMVLEVARTLAAAKIKPRRTIVFVHFAGEELGLWGSKALAASPPDVTPFKGGKVVAMINLDMVGRLGPQGLAIGGVGSSSGWMPLLDEVGDGGMKVVYDRAITSRSDHANFYRKDIPVLFFFTQLHSDYHRAGDEVEKINREGMVKIGALVVDLVGRAADGAALPFTPASNPDEGLSAALPGSNEATVVKRTSG